MVIWHDTFLLKESFNVSMTKRERFNFICHLAKNLSQNLKKYLKFHISYVDVLEKKWMFYYYIVVLKYKMLKFIIV